jgi:hypothetical protein
MNEDGRMSFHEIYAKATRSFLSPEPELKPAELARMLADGIRAAQDDEQIAKIIQLIVGDMTEPRSQALVLSTANAIIAKEGSS